MSCIGLHSGSGNRASGHSAIVGGRWKNEAEGGYAAVGGGYENEAGGLCATVSGGGSNLITGTATCAAIPGGFGNYAEGRHSFAAGTKAQALHDGAFVWNGCDDCEEYWNATPLTSTWDNQFLVRADGGMKVVKETSTFSGVWAALHVESAADGGEAAWLGQTNPDNPHAPLKLAKHPDSSANFMEGVDRSGGSETQKFHIDDDGTWYGGSDFAEALPVVGEGAGYEPGDVLVVSVAEPRAVERCRQPYDGAVVGVYSTRPGFVGADKGGRTEVLPGEIPVAVVGIVPVKVSGENGPIRPGDLLTTSATPGHAMRCEGVERCFGRTLGKALEAWEGGTGTIRMLVMLQ